MRRGRVGEEAAAGAQLFSTGLAAGARRGWRWPGGQIQTSHPHKYCHFKKTNTNVTMKSYLGKKHMEQKQ